MKLHNYIVFDCETGGLDKKTKMHAIKCPITQIGMLGLKGNSLAEIDRYESYIKGRVANGKYVGYSTLHDQEYQDGAVKATGITREILEEKGKNYKDVCNSIIEMFEKCSSGSSYHKTILVGHNVTYDIPFLGYLFKICKKDLSKYVDGYFDHNANFVPSFFDTMRLSRAKSIDEGHKHNLTEVSAREGFELIDAHSAINDVVATAEVFKKYILSIRNATGAQVQETVAYRDNFRFEY